MTVSKTNRPQPRTPTTEATKAANVIPPAAAPTNQVSGFGAGPATLPQEQGQPRIAKNALAGGALEVSPGALELESPAAKAAIEKAYVAMSAQAGFAGGADARQCLRPRLVEQDQLGMTHVRFERVHEGVKVFGEECIAHIGTDGKVNRTTGDVTRPISVVFDQENALPASEIEAVALSQFPGTPEGKPTVEKVFTQDNKGAYRAAYQVTVADVYGRIAKGETPLKMNYLVDAKTKEVIESWNQMGGIGERALKMKAFRENTGAPTPKARNEPSAGDDTSLYSGKISVESTKDDQGQWVLRSVVDGVQVSTLDAQNKSRPSNPVDVTDANNTWGEGTDSAQQRGAVDAHYAAVMFIKFLKEVYGRNSLDNKGMSFQSFVHVGAKLVNAFYTGGKMHYGDGDDKRAGPLTTLDIGGHEPGHGVIDFTSQLVYSGQSGGGNEGFADITGFGLEWFVAQFNKAVKPDFVMGEDCWTPLNGNPEDGLRYMDDPTKDNYSVDHLSNYPKQTEVHGSSGIVNKAFAMTVKGGTNKTSKLSVEEGIGELKALQIFNRGYTVYCTPRSDFEAQWKACVQAATDLFPPVDGKPSKEVQVLNAAWNAGMRMTPPTGINV